MKLIVGLGNPGRKYDQTRHNVGFEVIDTLAARWQISLATEKFHGWFGDGLIGDERVALLKPITFMNRSGQAVMAAGRFYQLELGDLLIVTDDVALPLGTLRMRTKGSAGGHNGLGDIIERIGSGDFCRLRLGVGPAIGDMASFVLNRFGESEKTDVRFMVEKSADAVECWVREGPDMTMTRFNGQTNGDQ